VGHNSSSIEEKRKSFQYSLPGIGFVNTFGKMKPWFYKRARAGIYAASRLATTSHFNDQRLFIINPI